MTDTSKFVSARVMQKNLFRHRLWVLAITLLAFFLYFVAYTALTLAALKSDPSVTTLYIQQQLDTLFFDGGAAFTGIIITAILAALSGIQGFLWMDKKNEVTFFESLPVSRTRRFWNIVLNSYIIYAVSYLIMLLIGLLLALGFAGNLVPVGRAMMVFVQNLFLFFAVYTSAVLAAMLTGNLFVAVLAEMVFLGFMPVLDIVIEAARSSMFRTYSGGKTHLTQIFSPLSALQYNGSLKPLLPDLLDGLVCLALAFWVYRCHRQSEDAGKSVLHRPVQWIAKIAVSAEAALAAGLIAGTSVGNSITLPVAVITIILTSVIVGGIMEAIYTRNIKSIFRHFPAALIASAVAIVIFSGYRFDWTGYDRWQPKATDVKDAYLYDESNYYTSYYMENGKDSSEPSIFYRRYMHLTDINDVNAILRAGQENKSKSDDSGNVITLIIGYRMKSGRTQKRRIDLPINETNTALMDKVLGTERFHQGYFQIYHDNFVEKELQHTKISYWNGSDLNNPNQVTDARKLYDGLRKAYLKDLTKFDFTLAAKGKLIGQIEIEEATSGKQTNGFDFDYPVYSTYTSTIAFLKENGLYQKPVSDEKQLSRYDPLTGPFSLN